MVVGVSASNLGGLKRDDAEHEGAASAWLYAAILVTGAPHAVGAVLNAERRGVQVNPWLAADVLFIPAALLFVLGFIVRRHPLHQPDDLKEVRSWMPLAGITGAAAAFAGLLFFD